MLVSRSLWLTMSDASQEYYMFHRVDMHKMLMDDALSEEGEGIPVKMIVDFKCSKVDTESGLITFANGATAQHDAIIGADGIGVCFSNKLG